MPSLASPSGPMSLHRAAPFLFALLVAVPLRAGAASDHAPLPVRNQMPMSAVFLDFVPLSAEAIEAYLDGVGASSGAVFGAWISGELAK